MVKITYDMPLKKKVKLDAEAFEAGVKVVDYHKNDHYTQKLKIMFSVGLIIYLIMGVFLGFLAAETKYYEQSTALCIENAKEKLGLTQENSISDLVDVCGYTTQRTGIAGFLDG